MVRLLTCGQLTIMWTIVLPSYEIERFGTNTTTNKMLRVKNCNNLKDLEPRLKLFLKKFSKLETKIPIVIHINIHIRERLYIGRGSPPIGDAKRHMAQDATWASSVFLLIHRSVCV